MNFRGTEGVVGLSRMYEKMELVFHISGCAIENQVKFATCTMLDGALTWWNDHLRTLGHDATYVMTWETLKKKMTNKYCPRGEIKKLEIELEKVDKYIGGLPDNIHGNVMSARPKTLDEAIELANDLIDQKLNTYAERQTKRLVKGMSMLELFHCATSASSTTLARALQSARTGHYKSDCLELKNQNHGNQAEGTEARGMVTTEKIVQIKSRIQAIQDQQKSYADLKRKLMDFQVGDRVMLKVLSKVGDVAYRVELPQQLSRVHYTFHVLNMKKCLSDESLVIPFDGPRIEDKLYIVEEPVEIMDREIKQLKRICIPIFKVRWNNKRGPEFTWE
nr:putative reverse transcriptase domain-containing protein [Tanacetum cinerariifolium]